MTTERIIRLPEVIDRVGMKKTAIYAKIKTGEFPEPLKLGRASGWLESEIQRWIGGFVTARNDASARAAASPAPFLAAGSHAKR